MPGLKGLQDHLQRWRRPLLLFSGGLDSTLLLAAAAPVFGHRLLVLSFTGPHLVPGELAEVCRLARRFAANLHLRKFAPLALPDFRRNSRRRCYVCKQALLSEAAALAATAQADVIWDGSNRDDLQDFRPGLQACREAGVVSPFLELAWDKEAIRALSRELGLAWDKPSQSCLATRFPYDTSLSLEVLSRVGQAETWLRARGFKEVRLRWEATATRLELPLEDWPRYLQPAVRRPFLALLQRLELPAPDLAPRGT